MVRTQRPTLQNIRIRSTLDAHKIFYSVYQGHLEMVTRRLDADERMALGSGCVYAWEERGPHTEITGLGIERFTEGRRWSPSRVRDEFLFYYEKYTPPESAAGQVSGSDKPQAPKDWDPLVKQTYSVWIDTEKGRRKWHLTAYFTQLTVDNLGTIDNIPGVGDLSVPDGMFKSTRVNKSRASNKALDESSVSSSSGRGNDTASGSGSGSTSTPVPLVTRTYAPFPAPYPYAVVTSNPVPMYEPYPAYPQQQLPQIPQPLQSQHPQQLVLLPRPQVPEHILEHQPPHSHYTLAAVTPGNSIRHLPLPTRTPYQNGNRVEYTHDPSVRYMSSALSSSPRIIAGAPPGSAYVPNYPMTTSYGAPGPPDHAMYSSVQSLPAPPPHPHMQQQQQQQSPSSPWYDEQHQHHPQSSPRPYSGVEPISPRPGPEYGEQSPSSNSFESPSPVIPTLVPLNLSSVRTPAEYSLVDDNSHSSTSSMSPMSPVSPTSPTSPMTPLHPMPPTSRIPPMPSMTPMPILPPPMSSPHPNTPPNPVHSPVYQSVYNIPRGMPSTYLYSSTYTMTPAFQYSPGGATAANNPATIASIAYMGDRAATPASPSTESSASGSVRSGGSGGSVRSMRSTGSAGSGGSVYVPSSSSLYGPGVPGVSSSRASAGDLRTNELVRSAELVRLSEPGIAAGSAGGGEVTGGGLSGSPQRAVPLPPLHSLKRSHPYRRHPEDDKTLRLLDPRPVPSVP